MSSLSPMPMADPKAEEEGEGEIRNMCILAHVDHGKTTLADHLIASCGGGVLHPKLAGRLRFMDFLDEEQRRAITMKSSSISLLFRGRHRVNLIDSPGHVDFCSEVSSAARLSDVSLVLVDAVEGVHIQTHAVLRQSWLEGLHPCLVLNKLDRLVTELRLSPAEAYSRLLGIVHDANRILSAFRSQTYLSGIDSLLSSSSSPSSSLPDDPDDDRDFFRPAEGNVAFVCALDGWGFRIPDFAELYAKRLGARKEALQRGLWGPCYYNPRTKEIVGKKAMEGVGRDLQPTFVQFVLRPLWEVYHAALEPGGDRGKLEKVIENFKLSVPPRDLHSRDPKVVLQAVLSRWLPLSESVLSMVVDCAPGPAKAQSKRISRLIPKRELAGDCSDAAAEAERVRKCVEACDSSDDAPCVVFVSKMFAVPNKMLPQRGHDSEGADSDECFLGFARVFSGVLRAGQKVFVLSALYDPLRGEAMQKHVQEAEVQSLYLMMGQGLKPIPFASAGNIVAIGGLGQCILKSATLSSTRNCWPFSSMMFQVSPTLRVAIEPSDPADMGALMKGLKLLNRADPFVEVTVSSRGEQVLAAAGEVHLERCIKDLKERFAKVSLEVSPPLVSYRETIEGEATSFLDGLKTLPNTQFVEKTTPNGRCLVRARVLKLPIALTKILEESGGVLGDVVEGKHGKKNETSEANLSTDNSDSVAAVRKRIIDSLETELESFHDREKIDRYRSLYFQCLERIWSLGPGQVGPNILLVPDSKTSDVIFSNTGQKGILVRGSCHVSKRIGFLNAADAVSVSDSSAEESEGEIEALRAEAAGLKSSIVSGFQLATAAGPLCDEPMWGLAFVVEPYIFQGSSENVHQADQYAIFSGQVMTAVKEACRSAVLQSKPRLVEGMYFCELSTPTEHLGAMYAVLARRRARVLKEEMQEGSPLFTVHAYVPVGESFGFADELRRWTSGASSALLVLSHWEALPEDPFFVPKTEEELEEFGDGSSVLPNMARKLMNSVRRRKGLPVDEKVVQHATKQRTLARKV